MTTRTSTLLALPLLLGLTTGAAQATLLEIELTGTLDSGSVDYTNEFGLGTYVDLTGQTATFRWLIDTDLLGTDYDNTTTRSYYTNCINFSCGNNHFFTASITINGTTQTITNSNNSYDSWIDLQKDQDGSGFDSRDYLYIGGLYRYENFTNGDYGDSYSYLQVYDFVDSIINGVGVDQLDGWSTNLISNNNDSGSAVFNLYDYNYNYQTGEYSNYRYAYGVISLSSANLRWGNGYDNSPSVPEPASLALLGIGLVGMSVVRRRRRG